jgi:hypothetical protein
MRAVAAQSEYSKWDKSSLILYRECHSCRDS